MSDQDRRVYARAMAERLVLTGIVPANKASPEDLDAVMGRRGASAECQCQRYKLAPRESFRAVPTDERRLRLLSQTCAGDPEAPTTTGLVAYLDEVPVAWCAVQPRSEYGGLLRAYRTPWEGRAEDRDDPGVWALTCFMVRAGYRHRGISYALTSAAVEFARSRGARAIEGYPMVPVEGKVTWGEEHVGFAPVFAAAGFREVSRPGKRRVVMRLDFGAVG